MTQISPDGQWWWDGHGWQPIATIPAPVGQQVSMADSVVTGDVNVVTHQSTNVQVNDAQTIVGAINTAMKCATCGSNNTTMYSCESTTCGTQFCNVCMQSYMHGSVGINGIFCQPHHAAEVAAVSADGEFIKWEKKMATLLKSYGSREMTKKMLIAIGALFAVVSLPIIFSGDPGGGVVTLIIGIVALVGGMSYPAIIEKTTIEFAAKMPDVMAHSRPQVSGRSLPSYSEDSVRDFVNGGMVI